MGLSCWPGRSSDNIYPGTQNTCVLPSLQNAAKWSSFSPNWVRAAWINTTQMIFTEIIQVIAFVFVFHIKWCLLDSQSVLRTKLGCVKLKIWGKPDHGSV